MGGEGGEGGHMNGADGYWSSQPPTKKDERAQGAITVSF